MIKKIFKYKNIKSFIALILAFIFIFNSGVNVYATEYCEYSFNTLVNQAIEEREKDGAVSDETIKKLEEQLNILGIDAGAYSETANVYDENIYTIDGYGETHSLSKGWTYRVDKPSAGDAKPHVHVDNNRLGIHGVENVDGTPSHGKSLDNCKVPKDVQDKVRNSPDYKKGKEDLRKMQQAKAEINRQQLNLNDYKDLILAAAIFVGIVGVAFFAPEALPAALALI